jgi:hypothetical protein
MQICNLIFPAVAGGFVLENIANLQRLFSHDSCGAYLVVATDVTGCDVGGLITLGKQTPRFVFPWLGQEAIGNKLPEPLADTSQGNFMAHTGQNILGRSPTQIPNPGAGFVLHGNA